MVHLSTDYKKNKFIFCDCLVVSRGIILLVVECRFGIRTRVSVTGFDSYGSYILS